MKNAQAPFVVVVVVVVVGNDDQLLIDTEFTQSTKQPRCTALPLCRDAIKPICCDLFSSVAVLLYWVPCCTNHPHQCTFQVVLGSLIPSQGTPVHSRA